jgi:hypothetical protein
LANRGFLQIQLKPGQIDVIYMIKRILAICMKRNVALNTFTLREWGRKWCVAGLAPSTATQQAPLGIDVDGAIPALNHLAAAGWTGQH